MSLNWSVENVEDYETVCKIVMSEDDPNGRYVAGDKLWNPVTESLVWLSISTGINAITEENAAEVYARVRMIEQVNGPMLIRAEVDGKRPTGAAAFITPEEVRAHVGLSTNASPKTRARFLKSFEVDLDAQVRHFEHVTAPKVEA